MIPSTLPAELNQPLPRLVAPRRKMVWISFGLPTCMLIFIFGVIGRLVIWPAIQKETLKERGVSAIGIIETATPQRTKGGSIFYEVDFVYSPAQQTQSTYQGHDKIFRYNDGVQAGMSVPVLYDPQNPSNAKVNINDVIRAEDPYRMLGVVIIPIGGFTLFTFIFIPVVFIFQYGREKKLLLNGSISIPTITGETEYNAGKAGTMVKIAYRFTYAEAQTVDGERTALPTAEKAAKYPAWQKQRDAVLKNPLVIYDPQDSRKNMLYPPSYAVCVLPSREWGR